MEGLRGEMERGFELEERAERFGLRSRVGNGGGEKTAVGAGSERGAGSCRHWTGVRKSERGWSAKANQNLILG